VDPPWESVAQHRPQALSCPEKAGYTRPSSSSTEEGMPQAKVPPFRADNSLLLLRACYVTGTYTCNRHCALLLLLLRLLVTVMFVPVACPRWTR